MSRLSPRQFHQQLQLPGTDVPVVPGTPGDMGFDEWSKRNDVVHHGTFRTDWDRGNATHFGDETAARYILNKTNDLFNSPTGAEWMRGYGSPDPSPYGDSGDGDTDPLEGIGEGRVFSRRLSNVAGPVSVSTDVHRMKGRSWGRGGKPNLSNLYSDRVANTAHGGLDYMAYEEPTGSVKDSMMHHAVDDPEGFYEQDDVYPHSKTVRRAMGHLNEGRPIGYENSVETTDSASYVVPRDSDNSRSWEQDVFGSPRRSERQKEALKGHMKRHGERTIPAQNERETVGWQGSLLWDHPERVTQGRQIQNIPRPGVPDPRTARSPYIPFGG